MANKYNKTWHSYRADNENYRYVALISLHTRRVYAHMFTDLKFPDFLRFAFLRLLRYDIILRIRIQLENFKKIIFNILKK